VEEWKNVEYEAKFREFEGGMKGLLSPANADEQSDAEAMKDFDLNCGFILILLANENNLSTSNVNYPKSNGS
jgi:hypothetical protein